MLSVSRLSTCLLRASSLTSTSRVTSDVFSWPVPIVGGHHIQTRGAARKGIRLQKQRLLKLKKLAALQQAKLNPPKIKKKIKIDVNQIRFVNESLRDEKLREPPKDQIYFIKSYKKPKFSLDECLEFHRQAVHPTVLNLPNSLVSARIELNLKLNRKKNKFIERFASTICYPHLFENTTRPRRIAALAKNEKEQIEAKQAGAIISGGMDIVHLFKTNSLTHRDFDHLVCHNNIIDDLAQVKNIKSATFFPNKQRGNYGDNIGELVTFFKNGVDYALSKEEKEPAYGCIECPFGRLDMENEHLKENLIALMESVNRFKPLNLADGLQFFRRVTIKTPSTYELFVLRFWELLDGYHDPDAPEEVNDEDEKEGEVSN